MYRNREFTKFLISQLKPRVYLEIGVGLAHHVNSISDTFFNSGGSELHVVDINPKSIKLVADDRVISHCMHSNDLSDRWNSKIDFLVIDGCHSHQQSFLDFMNFSSMLSQNGIILMHDTYPGSLERTKPNICGEVWKSVVEIFSLGDYELCTLPIVNGITIIKHKTDYTSLLRGGPVVI